LVTQTATVEHTTGNQLASFVSFLKRNINYILFKVVMITLAKEPHFNICRPRKEVFPI